MRVRVLKSPPKIGQIRTPLSPPRTAWTGFDLYFLYSVGSSPAGSALVGSSNHKTFMLDRGIVTDIMAATPASWHTCIMSVTMALLG